MNKPFLLAAVAILLSIIGAHSQVIESVAGTSLAITLPNAGPITVIYTDLWDSNQPSGSASNVMIQVDGLTIAQTVIDSTGIAFIPVSLTGVSASLTAGAHTITVSDIAQAGYTVTISNQAIVAIATQSISPAVQTALNDITAAYQAGDTALAGQLTSLADQVATDEGNITSLQQQIAALPTQTSITSLQQALAGAETQEASDVASLQQQINSLTAELQATNAEFGQYQKKIPSWQLYGIPFATSLGGGLAGSIFSNAALLPRPGGDSNDLQARPGYYDK